MFSTCIFCNKPLGRNESIESFPVGERLAFDPARGRLWVVCRSCERWNLTPLEERWEAIEEAERLFRDTKRRVSTDNIGLAKLSSGLTLVRIGEPQRPEFAAWRYGDQFGRRRTRAVLLAGGGVAAMAGIVAGGAFAGASVGGFAWMFARWGQAAIYGSPETIVARVKTDELGVIEVRRRHLEESSLSAGADGGLRLLLRFRNGHRVFTGPEAERLAAVVIPKVNRYGGGRRDVARAVEQIEREGDSLKFLRAFANEAAALTAPIRQQRRRSRRSQFQHGLFGLPKEQRLALEMALHEETERRALEGELAELEQAWRDAEEVAGIADNLLVPQGVETDLRRLKDPARSTRDDRGED